MEAGETTLTNEDGKKLHCYAWKPTSDGVRALIYIGHGYAEHTKRYTSFAQKLTEIGFYVFGHDNIGHGKSEGVRVLLEDYNVFVRDILQHIKHVKKEFPDVPCFFFGHSFGGLMAVLASHQEPHLFTGVVLSAPFLKVLPNMEASFKKRLLKSVPKWMGNVRMTRIDAKGISHDKTEVEAYKTDPLNDTGGIRLATAQQALYGVEHSERISAEFKLPIFITHGAEDSLCNIEGSKEFHEKAISKDKKLLIYEDAAHEMLNEIPEIRDKFTSDVIEWLQARIGRAENARVLFAMAGVTYKDVRISYNEWPNFKAKMPNGQMPVLEIDGKMYAQSKAMNAYLAEIFGFYGDTAHDRFLINQLIGNLDDIFGKWPFEEKDQAIKEKKQKDLLKNSVPKFLKKLENDLNLDSFFLEKVSLADVNLLQMHTFLESISPTIFDNTPKIKALISKISAIPNAKKWLNERPASLF